MMTSEIGFWGWGNFLLSRVDAPKSEASLYVIVFTWTDFISFQESQDSG